MSPDRMSWVQTCPNCKMKGKKMSHESIVVKFKKLHPDAVVPTPGSPKASGYDVVAVDAGVWSPDGKYIEYDLGLAVELPEGYHLKLAPRSSVSKYDLMLANGEGLIDCVPKGTMISTPHGGIPVEELLSSRTPTEILSFNEENFAIENDIVTDVWIKTGVELYRIQTEDGDAVEIPANKMVYTRNGWKKAKDILAGEEILKI